MWDVDRDISEHVTYSLLVPFLHRHTVAARLRKKLLESRIFHDYSIRKMIGVIVASAALRLQNDVDVISFKS